MRRSTSTILVIAGLCAASSLLTGCATMVSGVEQKIVFESERPGVQVKVDRQRPKNLPATVSLPRKEQGLTSLRILTPREDSSGAIDTVRLIVERRLNHLIWLNFATGFYGLAGLGLDLITGAAWRIEPDPRGRAPSYVRIRADPDPWKTGVWRGSVAGMYGVKFYPGGILPGDDLGGDIAVQAVVGHRDWPHELEGRLYLYSSLEPAGNWVIADLGVRKTLYDAGGLRPYLSLGASVLSGSTQPHGGVPLGVWGRAGLDVRGGSNFFFGPYLGYAKHEPVVSGGLNTGGVTLGLLTGFLW